MKRYKATKKFKSLGIDNSYQGLRTEDYYALRSGKEVELEEAPDFLLEDGYLEEVKRHKLKQEE